MNLLKAVVNKTEILVEVHLLEADIKRNLKGFLCNQYMAETFKCSAGALSSFVAVMWLLTIWFYVECLGWNVEKITKCILQYIYVVFPSHHHHDIGCFICRYKNEPNCKFLQFCLNSWIWLLFISKLFSRCLIRMLIIFLHLFRKASRNFLSAFSRLHHFLQYDERASHYDTLSS